MKTTDYLANPPLTEAWLMHVPVVSTRHIELLDDDRLCGEDPGNGPVMADLKTGWLLHLEDFASNFEGYSDTFLHLLETFYNLGFHYLRLDPDGNVLDDLPRFKW